MIQQSCYYPRFISIHLNRYIILISIRMVEKIGTSVYQEKDWYTWNANPAKDWVCFDGETC